jgi:hypothetical protein
MPVPSDHIIHSGSGQLGRSRTSVDDAKRIALQAWDYGLTKKGPIVMHFHGGLVNEKAAREGAERLYETYATKAGAYPIFSVWEAGLIETLRNNWRDILQDPVFQELVKKVGEWVLREGAPEAGTKSAAGKAIDVDQYRQDFDAWFAGTSPQPPLVDSKPAAAIGLKNAEPDEEDLALKIEAELPNDPTFEMTIAGLAAAAASTPGATTKGMTTTPRPISRVLVDDAALDQLLPGGAASHGITTKGVLSWVATAKFIAKVVMAVTRRLISGRDHGVYVTVIEEVLRAAYLAKAGGIAWGQMKKDTADAFVGETGAGNVILQAWAGRIVKGEVPPRVVLVGHSTGAVYIINWIRASAVVAPDLVYDIVLLAPACVTDEFAKVMQEHAKAMSNVRIFAMQDEKERDDVLVPILYPRSLLYFVSGVVEAEVDAPLLGMQRFLKDKPFQDAKKFPAVDAVRQYLAAMASRGVWSIAAGAPGLGSASVKHGDFDNDAATLASVVSIIKSGYA